ncbi:ead/Ea22-like family protein [Escherichia coli]|nr:ead/Ea22-like family protein [Escherichia coli]
MSEINSQALREAAVAIETVATPQKLLAFHMKVTPQVVLALLDERERNQQYIKRRDQENEDIALTVGKLRVELEAAENNLIDSECHVAELEEALRDKQALLEASEKRIAELEAEPVSQTCKLNEPSCNSPVIPDGWISCSEQMPNEEDVLVYCSDTKEQMVGFHKGKGLFQFFYMNGVEGVCEPSHWMPIPEPPQEVNRG